MMALTLIQVKDVCQAQASNKSPWSWGTPNTTCKYLTGEIVGKQYKQLCMKLAPGVVEKKRKDGMLAHDFDKLPDNCPGYSYLKYKDQGYDVP
jgi:hypothetical protein